MAFSMSGALAVAERHGVAGDAATKPTLPSTSSTPARPHRDVADRHGGVTVSEKASRATSLSYFIQALVAWMLFGPYFSTASRTS